MIVVYIYIPLCLSFGCVEVLCLLAEMEMEAETITHTVSRRQHAGKQTQPNASSSVSSLTITDRSDRVQPKESAYIYIDFLMLILNRDL